MEGPLFDEGETSERRVVPEPTAVETRKVAMPAVEVRRKRLILDESDEDPIPVTSAKDGKKVEEQRKNSRRLVKLGQGNAASGSKSRLKASATGEKLMAEKKQGGYSASTQGGPTKEDRRKEKGFCTFGGGDPPGWRRDCGAESSCGYGTGEKHQGAD
ncbi:unnamed protein product [Linum trigynum]|uniref:Uncharacterized protein n=1 Tax=Linum trigynum TaxID=586398 RepID=A0AAV2E6H5_9ROSI